MSLVIYIWKRWSGKTTHCLEEISSKFLMMEHPIILLVPEQYTFESEKD
ncbi:hypothetical protein Q5M85_23260 [Paraclostridium bifermentans]|nr:hypothetical protein [Paraclostridium bifermentans]